MENLLQDVRYGLRMLGKNPGFTAVALITLALGLGVNISVFTLVNALLLRPPSGVQRPESLLDIYAYTARQHEHEYGTFSYPDYLYFREHSTVFSGLASEYPYSQVNLVANGNSRDINGSVVSDNYFSLLGLQPSLGRFFLPEEQSVPDRDAVAVLGYDLWRRAFGSDAEIVGKHVKLNGAVFTIVGVGPREFGSPNALGQAIDVWMPAMMFSVGFRSCNGLQRDCHPVRMIGRLKPGQTIGGAEAEMNGLTAQLAAQYPDTDRGLAVAMAPLAGVRVMHRAETERIAKVLGAAVMVVLLIVSANLTGLLLARNHARKKEIAVRLAIGASPGRVVRQLLFESLPLSMLGCALGFVVALWARGIFISYFGLAGEARRAYFEIPFDFTVIIYSFGVAVITTLLFGMAPALQAGNFELIPALKDQGATSSPHHTWMRRTLVVAQVAMALVLAASAGLLVRSANRIYAGAGFDPSNVLLFRLRPGLVRYSPQKAIAFQQQVIEKLESLPGVESASPSVYLPLPGWGGRVAVSLPGSSPVDAQNPFRIHFDEVGPHYFRALRIPLIAGRVFNEADRADTTPAAVVNQTLAKHLWPDQNPLGRRVMIDGRAYQVIGLSRDTQYHARNEKSPSFVYLNYWQDPDWVSDPADARIVVRTKDDPEQMLPSVRRTIQDVDPDVPISEDRPLTEWLRYQFTPVLVARVVVTYSGLLALLLGAIGVYALLAHVVGLRMREIGIRKALGAQNFDVLGLVLRDGMLLALAGIALGLAASVAVGPALAAYLYGVAPADPLTMTATVVVISAVALLASYIPARRATKVDPMVALRYE
jgi:predicted permease